MTKEYRLHHQVPEARVDTPRLDVYVTDELKLFPRSQFKQRVRAVLLNGTPVKFSKKVRAGDEIEIVYTDPPPLALAPEPMALAVLYEDDDVIVVDKPQGLVVHPGAGNPGHTLLNGLLAHCRELSGAFGGQHPRPGIVHRLDKDTSGVLIAAKHPAALEYLSQQFRLRRVKKLYLALVRGKLTASRGVIETMILRDRRHRKRFRVRELSGGEAGPGKRAVTHYRVLREWQTASLVVLRPVTGRTHQLRVHLQHLGCSVLGDTIYGGVRQGEEGGLMLHALRLEIRLPKDGEVHLFKTGIPARFKKTMRRIGRADSTH